MRQKWKKTKTNAKNENLIEKTLKLILNKAHNNILKSLFA